LSYKKGEGDRVRKSLMKPLAIPPGRHTTPIKWLVMLKLLGVVVALMLSTTVSAVGMGGINVTSALGQPLKADIELVAISKSEKDSLVARLASPDAYKSAGLEYPYGNNFKFKIESRADGQPFIKATSAQPVNDPFVSLLVELTWSAGKLSREYTFLLDPPGYVAEQPAKTEVQAVAPEVQAVAPAAAVSAVPAAPEESVVTSAIQAAPVVAVTPEEQSAPVAAATEAEEQTAPMETEAAAKPEQAVPVATETAPLEQAASAVEAVPKEWIEVQRGDTMYKIAARYKLADMNLDRMLVAMYRANADKFDGRNMNRIRAGKILQLPSQQELASVSLPDAIKEIHAQASDWNAYRQKLASAAPVSSQTQETQQVATGKISSSIADMAPVAKESAKEVLKLSKGEAPGDQVGTGAGGKSMSEQDKKNAAQEDAIAKSKALKEQQERTALLEKNMQDMQRLAQLKTEAAALAQPPAAISAVSATASTVKPAPVAVQPKPKQAKPEPTLVDQIMAIVDQILGEPLYLAGGAAALLLLGGIGFMLKRRKKNTWIEEIGDSSADVGEITGRMAAPVFPSPDTGDFTGAASAQAATSSQSDNNVDPISEADLFLNFGRDVQAEEILKEALQSTPNNHQIHLKLLGIYAARKDANSFSTIARQLQGSGDDAAWQQAVAMGRKLEPDNPMYGGGFRSMEDTGSATVQTPAFNVSAAENIPKAQPSALDFDFDVGASAAKEAPSPEQDFLEAAQKTSIMTADGSLIAQGAGMDFDLTSANPSMPEEEPASKPADDGGMAFMLDFPVEKPAEKPAPAAIPDIGLAGINLNFDEVAAPSGAATGNGEGQWQDVETKLDLAKAYHEMGDASGAREILEEVLREGDNEQRGAAQNLLELLS
jgi:pilus assembly protein FimV